MKISIDVDCTPQEMRRFLGLPDLEPLQQAVMDDVRERMLKELEDWSTVPVMREWFGTAGSMQQAMMRMFASGDPSRRQPDGSPDE